MKVLFVLLALLVPVTCFAQSANVGGNPQGPALGLTFGSTPIMTGPMAPTPGQAVCNVNGKLGGCAGGGGAPACTGSVTLNSSGVGAFTNPCVTTASVCTVSYTSPTSYNNPITTNAPTNGGITLYNGVANLTVQVKC